MQRYHAASFRLRTMRLLYFWIIRLIRSPLYYLISSRMNPFVNPALSFRYYVPGLPRHPRIVRSTARSGIPIPFSPSRDLLGMIETRRENDPGSPLCLIQDGSWCSVCNKQWSADTEESPNYLGNANVSRRAEKSVEIAVAFGVRGQRSRNPGCSSVSSSPTFISQREHVIRSTIFRECILCFQNRLC